MTETYSLSGDFPGGINPYQLDQEIRNDPSITTTLNGVVTDDATDSVLIYFVSTLSGPEKTALDSLIAAYVFVAADLSVPFQANLNRNQISNTAYTKTGSFLFVGEEYTITRISVASYMDVGLTSYSVRVYDTNSRLVIAEITLSNTVDPLTDMGTISNIPTNTTLLEIQVKKTGPSSLAVYVDAAIFYLTAL